MVFLKVFEVGGSGYFDALKNDLKHHLLILNYCLIGGRIAAQRCNISAIC